MIQICGRSVKVQTGAKTQTVNICTSANINGQYDYRIRLRPPFIKAETLLFENLGTIDDLVDYLVRQHQGDIEQRPASRPNIVTSSANNRHPLTVLFQTAEVNNFASSRLVAEALTDGELRLKFKQQLEAAPYRGLHKDYFVGHMGRITAGVATNRREEHLAIALWRDYRKDGFVLPDDTRLFPVDYQLPLKSHRDEENAGLGKIDLFCAESAGDSWICELKIRPAGGGRVETPMKAMIEALAYCGTLDADMRCFRHDPTSS